MNEITATVMDASEVMDEVVVSNFSRLQDLLNNTDIFMLENLQMRILHDIGMVTIPMHRQLMIDDVVKELENYIDMNTLCAYRRDGGRNCKLVSYSMPYQDEMYIINMESEQYGIIEEINVTLFESLEVMLSWLRSCLQTVEEKTDELEIVEIQTMAELYKVFF